MIWTIYNHGTESSSHDGPGEIVNFFGNNDPCQQYDGKIVNEGAGSAGDPHDLKLKFAQSATGGTSPQARQGSSNTLTRNVYGTAIGGGVQENVKNTLKILENLVKENKTPEKINMLGWSRGAVTCIRIAYQMANSKNTALRNIPINIFAVDPVAGVGHNTELDATILHSNVKTYVATLPVGEKRRFFKPIAGQRLHITSKSTSTKVLILPLPGHHADTAKYDKNMGKITHDLAYRFLDAAGSPVDTMRIFRLSAFRAWKLYEQVMLGNAVANTSSPLAVLGLGVKAYTRKKEVAASSDYGNSFFPNYHAEMVFKGAFPVCYYNYFCKPRMLQRNTQSWAFAHSKEIVAEQNQWSMSLEMRNMLQDLPPAKSLDTASPIIQNIFKDMHLVG